MKVEIEVSDERVLDLVRQAGISYWGRMPRCETRGGVFWVAVEEWDGGKEYLLDMASMRRGVALMATKAPQHFADWLCGKDDAVTGDVFVQLCCFGEVVYG